MSDNIYENNISAEIAILSHNVEQINAEENGMTASIERPGNLVIVVIERKKLPPIERIFKRQTDLIGMRQFNQYLVANILTVSPFTHEHGCSLLNGSAA